MTTARPPTTRPNAKRAAAYAIATVWYAVTLAVARWCRRRPVRPSSGCAVVIGTFHNPGWYLSHAVPLTLAGLRDVIVVSDGPLPPLAGVRVETPPRWLTAAAGRTIAKLLWTLRTGRRCDADVFIGFHIIPNATIALVAARLLGRAACYQMTGGPIELIGGGYLATENQVLGKLRTPSRRLERLALAVAGEFDLAVVRGSSAKRFVCEQTAARHVAVIPGSVDPARIAQAPADRPYDLVFVGRLAPTKQPLQFIDVVAAARRRLPTVRACLVGDGPLMEAVRARIRALDLDNAIDVQGPTDDVFPYLSGARVFVLTSRSEGLSIAMVEAMMSGAVPVVADVGDLGDVVVEGENGFLIEPGNIEQYADRVVALVSDAERWGRFSAAAERRAGGYNSLERVAALWREHLEGLVVGATDETRGHAPAPLPARAERRLAPREHEGR